jgi:hypothetical protein
MPNRIAVFFVFLLATALLAACGTAVSRKVGIEQSLASYEKALRWQSIGEAYRYLRPELQPAYLPPGIESIRVVGYEVLDPPVEVRDNVVVQRVEVRYVNRNTQVMKSFMDEQVWESDDDGKTWLRANPMPAFP